MTVSAIGMRISVIAPATAVFPARKCVITALTMIAMMLSIAMTATAQPILLAFAWLRGSPARVLATVVPAVAKMENAGRSALPFSHSF